MNNLHLSEEAQNDLFEIKSYNEEELLNPSAALATVSRITKSLRILQNYAQTGAPLSSIANIESDYRFIISDNYISFYRAYGSEVYIDRILYARRDYMRILFGDSTTDKCKRSIKKYSIIYVAPHLALRFSLNIKKN